MSVELLQTLSLISYIIAGVLLLIGIALFFLLNIPKIYGDVSGRTARKAIEEIRRQNESTGNKAYKPSSVNAERGRLTDKITQSGRLQSRTEGLAVSVGTEKFATSMLYPTSNETTLLNGAGNETTVLNQQAGETELLYNNNAEPEKYDNVAAYERVTVDVEISFTESSEIIE